MGAAGGSRQRKQRAQTARGNSGPLARRGCSARIACAAHVAAQAINQIALASWAAMPT